MPASGPSRADVFGSGPWPAVSHKLDSLVIEDDQVLVGFEELDALAGETWNRVWRTWTIPLAATVVLRMPSPPTGRSWILG